MLTLQCRDIRNFRFPVLAPDYLIPFQESTTIQIANPWHHSCLGDAVDTQYLFISVLENLK